jgi:hydroxymethylpyrimidine/phosphomethylpyrimidine kinase
MISTEENVIAISDFLQRINPEEAKSGRVPIVLDPVLRSTSGRELLDLAAVTTLRERLLPLVDWITPNLAELAILSGEAVATREDLPRASRSLQDQIAQRAGGRRIGIFATGGHLDPPDDLLLLPDGEVIWLPGERVVTRSTHGTGCSLSSAFLARLVLGDAPRAAAASAKDHVAKALGTAVAIGSGISPVNNLWRLSISLPNRPR